MSLKWLLQIVYNCSTTLSSRPKPKKPLKMLVRIHFKSTDLIYTIYFNTIVDKVKDFGTGNYFFRFSHNIFYYSMLKLSIAMVTNFYSKYHNMSSNPILR